MRVVSSLTSSRSVLVGSHHQGAFVEGKDQVSQELSILRSMPHGRPDPQPVQTLGSDLGAALVLLSAGGACEFSVVHPC